jgi:excisionase family DNA binding protein
MEPALLLRIEEAGRLLGVSRSKAYTMVAAGLIPTVRVGGVARVPRVALTTWIDQELRLQSAYASSGIACEENR